MMDMIIPGMAGIGAVLVTLMIVQTARLGSTREAAESITRGAPAITLGATTSGLVLATDLVFVLVGAIFAVPDVVATAVLGVVGYLTLSDVAALTPETWGLITIAAIALAAMGTGED